MNATRWPLGASLVLLATLLVAQEDPVRFTAVPIPASGEATMVEWEGASPILEVVLGEGVSLTITASVDDGGKRFRVPVIDQWYHGDVDLVHVESGKAIVSDSRSHVTYSEKYQTVEPNKPVQVGTVPLDQIFPLEVSGKPGSFVFGGLYRPGVYRVEVAIVGGKAPEGDVPVAPVLSIGTAATQPAEFMVRLPTDDERRIMRERLVALMIADVEKANRMRSSGPAMKLLAALIITGDNEVAATWIGLVTRLWAGASELEREIMVGWCTYLTHPDLRQTLEGLITSDLQEGVADRIREVLGNE